MRLVISQMMRNEAKRCVKFKQNAKKDNESSHILIVP